MRRGIPESARRAVRELAEGGHEAFLCTGRGYSFVSDEVRQMGFTGMIANGGAYIAHHGEVLQDIGMDPQLAAEAVRAMRSCGLVPIMEGTQYMYYDPAEYAQSIGELSYLIRDQLGEHFQPLSGNEDHLQVAKFSAKALPGAQFEKACSMFAGRLDTVQHWKGAFRGTIEFTQKGITKGTAVMQVCERLGFAKADSIAFGDSDNDITMFDAVGLGVAMGGSTPAILERAAFVTDTLFEDGILHGLQRLHLIEGTV